MKKIYLAVFLACTMGGAAHAQISEGGIPWSMSLQNESIGNQSVARIALPAPDYDQYLKEDQQDALSGAAKPYRIGAMVTANLNLNNSGTWEYLSGGRRVWRLIVTIPGAKALDFFYDKFTLPQGVSLYLSNESGTQLLGAYTNRNNNEFNNFTNEAVSGNVAYLEMNIEPYVDLSSIQFNIARISPYYRGTELLYASHGDIVARPTIGESSPCHKNANCPEGDGEAYAKSKSATLRILVDGGGFVGFCSGTLINNTGNSSTSCKQYFLTASHCDSANGREDSHFSTWKFAYNYQFATCDGGTGLEPSGTRTGAAFRSRSKFPSFTGKSAVADFLLLELNDAPPPALLDNIYLSGWNRDQWIYENPEYLFYIGFHHPAGDVKKMSTGTSIRRNGTFNQTFEPNTHWDIAFDFGGTEGGSSGSGLFDKDGLLIGDLSGGPDGTGACEPMGTNALYSKLSYTWENTFDQAAFPGAQSRLKDWLDPTGSGTESLSPTKADCSTTGIIDMKKDLDASITVYPNPSTSGIIAAKFNLQDLSEINASVYDIMGRLQSSYSLGKIASGDVKFDLSTLPNGIYMLNITVGNTTVGKRIVIAK